MKRAIGVLLGALLAATPALAEIDMTKPQPGYVYFNRPGADMAQHDAEITQCLSETARTIQPVDTRLASVVGVFAGGVIPAAIAGGIVGAMSGFHVNSGTVTNLENCMVVRGWRVIGLEKEEGQALSRLQPAELAERLSPWIGAERPHGGVIRAWRNDLTRPDIRIYNFPGDLEKPPLSLQAWSRNGAPTPRAGYDRQYAPTSFFRAAPKNARAAKPVKAKQLGAIPAGSAVVIVRFTGPNTHRGQALTFFRPGPDGVEPAWKTDNATSTFATTLDAGFITAAGKPLVVMAAYIVPAGHWRLEGITEDTFSTSFCLGAPSFDVKAGDVVFAGTFDLNARNVGPDMAMEPATAFLAGSPLAASLQPAPWRNGDTFPCRGQWIYAMELQAAPFVSGYAWGGAYRGAQPAT